MLRFSLILSLAAVLISCQTDKQKEVPIDYTGFSDKKITLVGLNKDGDQTDTLGLMFIKIPNRLDTFYKWVHFSDCSSCHESKYRFADNRYEQYAEGGFFWTVVLDSVYQLNVWHVGYVGNPDSAISRDLSPADSSLYYNRIPNEVSSLGNVDFFKREFRSIGNRNYAITGFITKEGYLTQKPTVYLIGCTRIKHREILIMGECSAKDTTGFVDAIYKSLLSVQIVEK